MKPKVFIPLSVTLLGVLGYVMLQAHLVRSDAPAPLTSVAGYKKWVRVNRYPHMAFSALMTRCSSAPPELIARDSNDPHKNKFVVVYVNKTAKRAMLEQKSPIFPQGSIVVKEKLTTANSKSPELLTVMYKREKGYNSASGDWEYQVYNGAGTKIQAQGRLEKCQSCHEDWKNTDYISRQYFTDEMKRNLK